MQDKDTFNPDEFLDISRAPKKGRIIALDPGTKKVGVAVSDETQTIATPIRTVKREGWKKFLLEIIAVLNEFDAVALVIGLPLEMDGSENEMTSEAKRFARNFAMSLEIPVFLQDERVSSYAAKNYLWNSGLSEKEARKKIDSEAAAIILRDFLSLREERKNLFRERD